MEISKNKSFTYWPYLITLQILGLISPAHTPDINEFIGITLRKGEVLSLAVSLVILISVIPIKHYILRFNLKKKLSRKECVDMAIVILILVSSLYFLFKAVEFI